MNKVINKFQGNFHNQLTMFFHYNSTEMCHSVCKDSNNSCENDLLLSEILLRSYFIMTTRKVNLTWFRLNLVSEKRNQLQVYREKVMAFI